MLPPPAIKFYSEHPIEFCERMLHFYPDQNQRPILRAVATGKNISVRSGHGTGKCPSYLAPILLANGVEKKAGELINTTQKMLSFDDNWNQIEVDAYFSDNGVKDLVCLQLDNGTVIKVTENHPLYAAVKTGGRNRYYRKNANNYLKMLGFTESRHLSTNHFIAVPTEIITKPDNTSISEEESRILGYLIADGCLTHGSILSNSNPLVIEDFRFCANKLGYKVTERKAYKYRGKLHSVPKFYKRLQELGLLGKNAHEKFVPDCIKRSSNKIVKSFLKAIYSCDASFSYNHYTNGKITFNIKYTSVSNQLAMDIRNLLLRFGINASIRKRKTSWTYKGIKKNGVAYTVDIRIKKDILKFNSLFRTIGKFEMQEKLTKVASKEHSKELKWRTEGLRGNLEWARIKKVWKEVDRTVAITIPATGTYLSNYAYEHNTALISCVILWKLACFPFCKILCTSQTAPQLNAVLWSEIRKWIRRSVLSHLYNWTATRVSIKGYENEWFAVARTAKEPEGLAGFHEAKNLVILADEASGIEESIFEVIDGALTTPGSQLIMTGNPLRTSGRFYDSFHDLRDLYECFHINCINSSLVRKEYILDMRRKWGEDSDIYRTRVDGDFPSSDPHSFIPLEKAERAILNESKPDGDLVIGIDIARFGTNSSVMAPRRGFYVYPLRIWSYCDVPTSVGNISANIRDLRKEIEYYGPIILKVDDIGVGGGVVDGLNHISPSVHPWWHSTMVQGVNFGGKGDDYYADVGTKAWGEIKRLISHLHLPDDEELIGQLTTRRAKPLPTGKTKLESKEEMRARGVQSPDRADAVALSFAEEARPELVIY